MAELARWQLLSGGTRAVTRGMRDTQFARNHATYRPSHGGGLGGFAPHMPHIGRVGHIPGVHHGPHHFLMTDPRRARDVAMVGHGGGLGHLGGGGRLSPISSMHKLLHGGMKNHQAMTGSGAIKSIGGGAGARVGPPKMAPTKPLFAKPIRQNTMTPLPKLPINFGSNQPKPKTSVPLPPIRATPLTK